MGVQRERDGQSRKTRNSWPGRGGKKSLSAPAQEDSWPHYDNDTVTGQPQSVCPLYRPAVLHTVLALRKPLAPLSLLFKGEGLWFFVTGDGAHMPFLVVQ